MSRHAVNKGTAPINNRVGELEKDLIGGEVDQAVQIDTGKDGKLRGDGTSFQRDAAKTLRIFQTKQGHRRRHPKSVLSSFAGVRATSEGAASLWEKNLLEEHETFTMEREFTAQRDIGMSNQLGVSQMSNKAFGASEPKLSRMHLVGV